ncbi:MAG: hypothetical protein JST52_01245 [Bacteroidetes bacterium]|nr:hypothetical protein [Bacteroidota bacterium]MBS1739211.1 hypothetical protein [Bacteroidota bacterium]MBS1775660.1 hypothetical protein [Bacteroidota bacterium]
MIRLKRVSFLILLLCISYFPKLSAQNLGVHPTTLEFRLAAGQSESQAIHLSNSSPKKVQFRLYLNDWLRDSMGGHIYSDPNKLPHSCTRWVTIDKSFVELEPGKSTDVTVKLALPDSSESAEEMKWSMLFIETVEEQKAAQAKGAQAAVKNLLRIGVHIYQTPPGLVEKAVKVFDLKPVPGESNIYRLSCQNIGKVMVDCRSYIELASLADGKKTKLEAVEFPLFPSQRRLVVFELPKDLPKGKYSALAVLDAGEDVSLEAVESEIEIK